MAPAARHAVKAHSFSSWSRGEDYRELRDRADIDRDVEAVLAATQNDTPNWRDVGEVSTESHGHVLVGGQQVVVRIEIVPSMLRDERGEPRVGCVGADQPRFAGRRTRQQV